VATYKKPCIHCNTFIDGDARFCPTCASSSPFGYQCPACLHSVEKDQRLCSGCGKSLFTICPQCGQQTFKGEKCDICGVSLMVMCVNPRCGEMQFFENARCTSCGKKLK